MAVCVCVPVCVCVCVCACVCACACVCMLIVSVGGAVPPQMGWNSQPTCSVFMEDCKVPASAVLGAEGEGFTIAMKGLDGGRLNIASSSLGGAAMCLNAAVEHVRVRQQFGKPLSKLQSVQFKLADMATEVHASRLLVGVSVRGWR